MKTFLKILLVAAVLIVAIKLSPVIFVGAILGLLAAAVLGSIGLSLVALFIAVLVALTAVLAPIWIPVLCIIGLGKLFRREQPNVVTA